MDHYNRILTKLETKMRAEKDSKAVKISKEAKVTKITELLATKYTKTINLTRLIPMESM